MKKTFKEVDDKTKDVVDRLKPELANYLHSKGVVIRNQMFRCIHPDHEDRNPSASFGGKGDGQIFHCFSCGTAGDIFHAVHLIEGLSITGNDFYQVTLPKLADQFNISYVPAELSEADREIMDKKRAYAAAARIVNNFVIKDWDNDAPHVKIVKERDINLTSVKDFQIGSIPSVDEYEQQLIKTGFSKGYLQDIFLLDRPEKPMANRIFATNKIILPICNHVGEVVAFVSRNSRWRKEDETPKYINSIGSDIYSKDHTLYGLHLAGPACKTKSLHIVEGYIDCISLRQHGFKNVAALGSAAFCPESMDLLTDIEITDIVISSDGDEGGRKCTSRALDEFAKRPGTRVRVKQLPRHDGYSDPDEILRSKGLKRYKEIEEVTPFKWLLQDSVEFSDKSEDDIVDDTCNQIKNEQSPLKRAKMARELFSVVSNFTYQDLMDEVKKRMSDADSKMNEEINYILDDLDRKRRKGNPNLMELMRDTLHKAKVKAKEYKKNDGDPIELYNEQMQTAADLFRTSKDLNGFKLNRFPKLEGAFDGFPDSECMLGFAGRPNVGKSTLFREISWDIALSNPNAFVIYMSIDDSTRDVIQSIVAREAHHDRQKVYKYNQYCDTPDLLNFYDREDPPTIGHAIDKAWKIVRGCDNYAVFDVTQGNSLMHLQDHIDYVKQNYPNKKPILFLDNFHKLSGSASDLRIKFVDLSAAIKEISTRENIPIAMTVELRKGYGRPRADEIAETVQLEYDCKVVALVHQEMHSNPDTSVSWPRETYGTRELMPYLEVQIYKNKHTSFKGMLGYRFEPDRSILTECEFSEIKQKYDSQKKDVARKEQGLNSFYG